jgi:hypothetical protein
MDSLNAGEVLFLGEQDGVVERELKTAISGFLLSHPAIYSAYLARVSYQEAPGPSVALCLRGRRENVKLLVTGIGEIFKNQFNTTQHLDIFFLSDLQLQALERVAKPFYVTN